MIERLDDLYRRYNRREFVHPDPLEFLYRYDNLEDREIVGLIAAGLAYGRVASILNSVGAVLERMGPGPARFVDEATLRGSMRGFRHRWTTAREVEALLEGIRRVRVAHGSLGAFMKSHGSLASLVTLLTQGRDNSLLPDPAKTSACKRLHLYMRWMVRKDDVDPGGWDFVPRSALLVPLDVHMHRVARRFGFTNRKQANLATALEVTAAFRRINPEDPVKYDFALTRPGIRGEEDFPMIGKSS